MLFSVFVLAQSSRSTKRSKTCCYATSCRQRAASSDRPQADEIWLSSDQQWPACPTRQPAKCTTILQCMQFSTFQLSIRIIAGTEYTQMHKHIKVYQLFPCEPELYTRLLVLRRDLC